MNDERRKKVKAVITKMKSTQTIINDVLDSLNFKIQSIQTDEEFAFDNLPESFQSGITGDTMQDNIDILESASNELEVLKEDIKKRLEEIKNNLIIL